MKNLYETDFYAWTKEQAEFLKNKIWEQVDLPNLIEEIESLGRQERQELAQELGVLKWKCKP
jgi:hypothetical protein